MRVKKHIKNHKTQQINLRVSNSEKAKLTELAERDGVSLSVYLINCGLKRKPPLIDADTQYIFTQIMYELNQIGNNFNQLAKTCHLSRKLGEPVMVDNSILLRLDHTLNKVKQAQQLFINSTY